MNKHRRRLLISAEIVDKCRQKILLAGRGQRATQVVIESTLERIRQSREAVYFHSDHGVPFSWFKPNS